MKQLTLQCRCGACRLDLRGPPIVGAECHCSSCGRAADRLEALAGAGRVRTPLGGTQYVLYRKDRVACAAGSERLVAFRLAPASPTRRAVAECCGTPMFLEFEKGHWVSIYADLWPEGGRPRMNLRTMTGDRTQTVPLPDDLPNPKSHTPGFVWRLVRAWIGMGFRVPRIDFVTEETVHE